MARTAEKRTRKLLLIFIFFFAGALWMVLPDGVRAAALRQPPFARPQPRARPAAVRAAATTVPLPKNANASVTAEAPLRATFTTTTTASLPPLTSTEVTFSSAPPALTPTSTTSVPPFSCGNVSSVVATTCAAVSRAMASAPTDPFQVAVLVGGSGHFCPCVSLVACAGQVCSGSFSASSVDGIDYSQVLLIRPVLCGASMPGCPVS